MGCTASKTARVTLVGIDTDGNSDDSTAATGWKDELMALTDDGLGVDVAIEAVGVQETFQMATEITARHWEGV